MIYNFIRFIATVIFLMSMIITPPLGIIIVMWVAKKLGIEDNDKD